MNVTKYEVEQWLDTQIEARRLANITLTVEEHEDDTDDKLVNLSRTEGTHLTAEAVRFIADMFKLDLCVKSRKDSEYPYEIFVLYKHEIFFGIETEAQYRERGAVV